MQAKIMTQVQIRSKHLEHTIHFRISQATSTKTPTTWAIERRDRCRWRILLVTIPILIHLKPAWARLDPRVPRPKRRHNASNDHDHVNRPLAMLPFRPPAGNPLCRRSRIQSSRLSNGPASAVKTAWATAKEVMDVIAAAVWPVTSVPAAVE